MSDETRFAVLIDAENISPKYIQIIFDEVSNYGISTYRRIYGDWTSTRNNRWKEVLLFNSIGELPQLQSKMNGAKALVEKYARETMTQDPQLPVCEKQIALKQIEKAFGAKTIFQNLSVSFTLGQKYRLVGPSGCGKSMICSTIYRAFGKGITWSWQDRCRKI